MLFRFGFRGMRAVFLETACQREFAQAVADHIFGHEHRVEYFAVVHVEGEADEIRGDHRAARPSLDRRFGFGVLGLLDFLQQMAIDERTFFNGSSHKNKLNGG